MSKLKNVSKTLALNILISVSLTLTSCGVKTNSVSSLQKDILGVTVGMSKENVERHLREIGKFVRDESRREQVWSLNNHPSFGYLAIGYDKDNQVRYVTALAKLRDGQPAFYKDIGDLTTAKQEIAGPNHRYTWEVPASGNNSGYSVIAQGANADSLSSYTLSKLTNAEQNKDKEEEEEEDK